VIDRSTHALRAALAAPLPGLAAQLLMAPSPRHGWDPRLVPPRLRDAAALLLVYPGEASLLVPLTVRGHEMRAHTGQVSFPGGKVDEGESIERAALREAVEEVGIDAAAVEILGRLTSVHIPVSGFHLHPVVGITRTRPVFRPAAPEVARVLEVEMTRLTDPATRHTEPRVLMRGGQPVDVDVPYYDIDGEKVWGATAMILAEFLALVERA